MFDSPNELPTALPNDLEVGKPNAEVKLYEGTLRITSGNNLSLEGEGVIQLEWLPSPRLSFRVQGENIFHQGFSIFDSKFTVEALDIGLSFQAFGTHLNLQTLSGVATGKAQSVPKGGICKVKFYLPNFNKIFGESLRDLEKNVIRRDRLSFDLGDQKIVIEGLPGNGETYELLGKQGGYALTHIGYLESTTPMFMNVEEVERTFNKLFSYFSFCRGAFSSPILFTGYNNVGAPVWTSWSVRRISPWQSCNGWFPVYNARQTKQLLSAYLSLVQDDKWDEALRRAIHWLVEAQNASNADMGIVHAQIGIELLAWAKFVELDQAVSKEGFSKLTAVDRTQLLLSWAGIPTAIPHELQHLFQVAAQKQRVKGSSKWNTGLLAIGELRNSIVHPNLRDRTSNVTPLAVYETWQLAIWYLELLVLRFLG